MLRSKIFGNENSSSEENEDFKTNNDYAKKYDTWRKKEELNRLKTKYGEDVLDETEESSSSSDDEEGVEITEDLEKDFFKTLACLKNKDPSIYKNDVSFFGNHVVNVTTKKKKKDKPMFLKDYERNLILEKGGVLSDEDDSGEAPRSPTYNEEQKNIKDDFKKALEESDEENEENWGGIFKERNKTKEEVEKEESDYKQWLAGQKNKPEDKKLAKDLKPLKEYWNNPDLDDGEKYLRDYILNKKYLNKDDDDSYIPTYEEVVHDSDKDLSNDEVNIEKQEEFEHKYNFRFEEPDQDFIKRYPRTMENSLRKTDDRRKLKRQEIKDRKKQEKKEKMQDVKKMQELKLKEIEEKLEQLKEITGNASLGFANDDIDGDFDPTEHDRKMQMLFNDEFYAGPEDEQKPEFPDLDEELELENWERYNHDQSEEAQPHCEDEDFNMDCDYDPSVPKNEDESIQGRKKRKKKSKFALAVGRPKPKFDPNDKKFEKYFEEYYKLDCEDIIGDIPCRFKYRKVVPNDFGLTTEEILLANERELNKWCSLKKAVQIRPDDVERYEQIAYKKKGQNVNLKMKILPSLFTTNSKESVPNKQNKDESIIVEAKNDIEEIKNSDVKVKNKKKQKKNIVDSITKQPSSSTETNEAVITGGSSTKNDGLVNKKIKKKKKNKSNIEKTLTIKGDGGSKKLKVGEKRKFNENQSSGNKRKRQDQDKSLPITDARLSAYGINPKRFKNKLKYKK